MNARTTDPWTSWAAAKSVNPRPSQAAVMRAFAWKGGEPMCLERIVECVYPYGFSESRIRTAVSELMAEGQLVDTGETTITKRGRKARLIGLADGQLVLL